MNAFSDPLNNIEDVESEEEEFFVVDDTFDRSANVRNVSNFIINGKIDSKESPMIDLIRPGILDLRYVYY